MFNKLIIFLNFIAPISNIAFVIMYMVSVVIVITYPILACVEAPIPLMGYIIGAIYSDI